MSRAKAKRPAPKAAQRAEEIESQRKRLLGADAIIICVQRAHASLLGAPDEIRVADALQVASEIINDAVEALEVLAK